MNAQVNELLEDARIHLEIDSLTEATQFAYLYDALTECGIEPVSESWDDLLDEAEDAWLAERRTASRNRSGWKKVFGVLRKVGRVAGKAALWGGGAGLRAAGWALKGIGSAASHVGRGMHSTNKKIAWTSKKRRD